MSYSRRQKREFSRHMNVLGELLGKFYEYLEQTQKPNDEEIRSMFLSYQKSWILYCQKKQLSEKMMQEFNHQVSEAWKHKQKTD